MYMHMLARTHTHVVRDIVTERERDTHTQSHTYISYHITSYHIISHHIIISYHIISYHIISYHTRTHTHIFVFIYMYTRYLCLVSASSSAMASELRQWLLSLPKVVSWLNRDVLPWPGGAGDAKSDMKFVLCNEIPWVPWLVESCKSALFPHISTL